MTWLDDSTLDLDGHSWAVRQAGDPDGFPLVYFHGTPSGRLEPAYADEVCADLGVRLVSFDRPGYGGSSPQPFSLSSVARSTGEIADRLGLDRFSATGQSGGGPFALACAAVHGDRVHRVGLTGSAAPFHEVPGMLDLLDENDQAAVALLPDREAAARQFSVGFEPFREATLAGPDAILAGMRQLLSAHDNEVLDRPGLSEMVGQGFVDGLRPGTVGAGWDNVAWVGPWDIDLADVRRPVHLWNGTEDPMASPASGQWMAERLPDATMHLHEGEGHLIPFEHTREVVETLTAR